jgi:hypothetical protein
MQGPIIGGAAADVLLKSSSSPAIGKLYVEFSDAPLSCSLSSLCHADYRVIGAGIAGALLTYWPAPQDAQPNALDIARPSTASSKRAH